MSAAAAGSGLCSASFEVEVSDFYFPRRVRRSGFLISSLITVLCD